MTESRVERVRAVMPPEGTDLVGVFGVSGAVNDGGLVATMRRCGGCRPMPRTSSAGRRGSLETWADWLEPWQSYRVYYDDILSGVTASSSSFAFAA